MEGGRRFTRCDRLVTLESDAAALASSVGSGPSCARGRTLRAAPVAVRTLRRGRVTQPAPFGAALGPLPTLEAQCAFAHHSIRKLRLVSNSKLGNIARASPSRRLAFGR